MDRTMQRGQALILIALAFVGLAAFIGLAVDAGILFTSIGHLRRATDAAALAAANQFREGRSVNQIEDSATEFITLNALNPATANIFICDIFNTPPDPTIHDPTLCPAPGDFNRKFVRVEAQMPVNFAFLPLVGWQSVTISANSVSEAASIDLVLAIDVSSSMAFDLCSDGKDQDDDDGDGVEGSAGDAVDDCPGFPGHPQVGPTSDADVALCILNRTQREAGTCGRADGCPPQDDCHPFEEVRAAAAGLIARTYFPYDRMSIIQFSDTGGVAVDLATGTNATSVTSALGSLDVRPDPGSPQCNLGTGDPSGCTSTNTAEGLTLAGNQFGLSTREEAVWIVILLSDGAANAARTTTSPPLWVCPGGLGAPTWVTPFCREPIFNASGVGAYGYDPEDAARAAALYVGCPDGTTGPLTPGCSLPGQAAVIFTIGLGNLMTNNTSCDVIYGGTCQPDQGERLLRWIAGVGDDSNPSTNPECAIAPTGTDCGNYYFSPTGSGLMRVFEAIASRIFTRITH